MLVLLLLGVPKISLYYKIDTLRQTKGHEYDEIRDNQLGWDVTDYGMGDYGKPPTRQANGF